MDGTRLGVNVEQMSISTVKITTYDRDTKEIRETRIAYQDFARRLFGHQKWYSRKKYVIDKLSFGKFNKETI